METFLIRALQLVMSLSLLVIIHEGGHFLFARLFKVRVEKFCIFFDPWFTLFKFKPKHSDTEYGLGWLPLGGYVKIAGMIDESMDTDQMKKPPQPWEFRVKPAWQRLMIMVAGVFFNFLLALFIYSMMLFTWGDEYFEIQNAPLGMTFNETAKSVGFKDGDILFSADGVPFERYGSDVLTSIVDAREVTVLRNHQKAIVYIPGNMMDRLMADSVRFASFRIPYVIDSVLAQSSALKAGLMRGDSIIAMNGHTIDFYDFLTAMSQRKDLVLASVKTGNGHAGNSGAVGAIGTDSLLQVTGQSADSLQADSLNPYKFSLTYMRAGVTHTTEMVVDSTFKIGVIACSPYKVMPTVIKKYGFFESFPAGITLGVNTLGGYVNSMKYVFSKEGVKQLGGFGTIGSIFPATWDWHQFWNMTAFLSIILAFMNILPIPALDGGHVLFLLYEIIARRKPSDKFMEYAEMCGIFILFALLIWANFNDIMRFFF